MQKYLELTLAQASRRLGLSLAKTLALVRGPLLRGVQRGGSVYVTAAELARFEAGRA